MRMRVINALRRSEMAIPLIYNVRSVRARWTSTIVAILASREQSASSSPCFPWREDSKPLSWLQAPPATCRLARRFTHEMMGGITLDSVKLIQDKPGVARDANALR